MDKTTYKIDIKGSIPSSFTDFWTGKMFADISYGYSSISFTGTEEELNVFLRECYRDETYFKVIGCSEKQ